MPFGWRSDADLARGVPATRRIMPLIMRRRNESLVTADLRVDVTESEQAVAALRAKTGAGSLLDLVAWALARTLHERPRLNRFTSGGRLYQRRGVWISASVKRRFDDDGAVSVTKRRFEASDDLLAASARLRGGIQEERAEAPTRVDKELSLLLRLPIPLLSLGVRLVMLADDWGMLPRSFIDGDPLFASAFIANLGSIGMDAAAHHLYEYGNIPLFLVMGRVQEDDGRRCLPIKASFDERVEDGFYALRCLERFRELAEGASAADLEAEEA